MLYVFCGYSTIGIKFYSFIIEYIISNLIFLSQKLFRINRIYVLQTKKGCDESHPFRRTQALCPYKSFPFIFRFGAEQELRCVAAIIDNNLLKDDSWVHWFDC